VDALRVHAKASRAQDEVAPERLEVKAALTTCVGESDGSKLTPCFHPSAMDSSFDPITAGPHERAPNRRFRRSGALSARGGR